MSAEPEKPIDEVLAEVAAKNPTFAEVLRKARQSIATPEALARFERQRVEASSLEGRQRRKRLEKAMEEVGIPLRAGVIPRLGRSPGETPPPLEDWPSRRHAASFGRGPRRLLALVGDMGTGKTTAAAAVVFSRLDIGPAVYVRERVLERWLNFARYEDEWDRAVNCATLVIDELGTATRKDEARMALLEICDSRMSGRKRTIVIGNLSAADFAAYVDKRLYSRWLEIGTVAHVEGEDRRAVRSVVKS
jgi:hypothetical protein